MAIVTPAEYVNTRRPTTTSDAAAAAAASFFCKSAPLIAGYGVLTGNVPAVGAGTALGIACGIPFLTPDPPPDTGGIPFPGGQDAVLYDVRVRLLNHNLDCSVANNVDRVDKVQGPVSQVKLFVQSVKYECRDNPSDLLAGGYSNFRGDTIIVGNYSPDVGGYYSMSCTRSDHAPDTAGNPPYEPATLPPGYLIPPGYPTAPFLPGEKLTVPVYKDKTGDSPPYKWIPFVIPPVPLPVVVPVRPTLNASANVPINIPVKVDAQGTANVEPTFNFQIDDDGNIRTPPDLLCQCEHTPDKPGGLAPADIDSFQIPYFECSSGSGSFKSVELQVLSGSVPSDLEDKLLSSANLAEIACDSLHPKQEEPSLLYSGVVQGILVAPWFSPVLPEYVVSVELRIVEFSPSDFREISGFPGASQYKFGSFEYTLEGITGGVTPQYVWDKRTYYRLPRRIKPGRLRVLMRSGVSFEIWDTGERLTLR